VFVALVIQHTNGMSRVKMSSVAFLFLPYFVHSHTRHYFRKKKLLDTKCVFSASLKRFSF